MKSHNCIVVSACKKYLPEICTLLNSKMYIGNTDDVYLIGYQLPKEFTDQFSKLDFRVILYDVPEKEAREFGGESEIVCRKRFFYAAEWGKQYAGSTLILDADMFFIRSVDPYFEIAEKTGLILGASLEQKRMYGHIEHHKSRGKHILSKPTWNHKDICCSPMFVDMKIQKYEMLFKKSWEIFADGFPVDNFKAPDMESYNLLILHEGLSDRVVLLPNVCWCASNEKLLKPHIRAIGQRDGKLWTETGEPIFIVHGQYYKKKWRDQQLINRHGCAKGYLGCTEKPDGIARGAMETLFNYFKKMLDFKITVEKKAYVNFGGHIEIGGEI